MFPLTCRQLHTLSENSRSEVARTRPDTAIAYDTPSCPAALTSVCIRCEIYAGGGCYAMSESNRHTGLARHRRSLRTDPLRRRVESLEVQRKFESA